MAPTPRSEGQLGRRERMLLAAVAGLLALGLFWLRGGINAEAPLQALARRSLDPATALANGRPTVVEFYADWCEACRSMAPAMLELENRHQGALDVVLLNVDNPRWQPQVETYGVNGIPHLELFDAGGQNLGRAIGARSSGELAALTQALLAGEPLPALAGVGAVSALEEPPDAAGAAVTPRSHG